MSMPNNLREISLAQTGLKRVRNDDDEDYAKQMKIEDQQPPASVNERGKLSCDQCYHQKIRVRRSPVRNGTC
jgi:hypothetical protein